MRLIGKQWTNRNVPVKTDRVIGAFEVPGGSRVNALNIGCNIIAGAPVSVIKACFVGIHAYLIPHPDPEESLSPDTVWDEVVPKMDAIGSAVLDMDTVDSPDVDPVFEPGDVSLNDLVSGAGEPEKMIPGVNKLLTFANTPAKGFESGSPDTWYPTMTYSTRATEGWDVEVPSLVAVAVSSPATTQTLTAYDTFNMNDWVKLRYAKTTLEEAHNEIVGMTEAGATTPWADSAKIITDWLILVFEATAGKFDPVIWEVFSTISCDITVEGEFSAGLVQAATP